MERAKGTDLRVMSWNILSEELSPVYPNIADRFPYIEAYIRENAPDCAGIQEISESCYALFREKMSDLYEFVNPVTKKGEYSFTGVMYNKNKFDLLDTDIEIFEAGNPRIRIMNWIHLKEKGGKRHFVLLSTHWDRHACNRPLDARRMGEAVVELREKFRCPVICTGDFNARETSNAFLIYQEIAKQKDTKYEADVSLNHVFSGHPVGTMTPEFDETESIDHILVDDIYHALHFEIVLDESVRDASDHFPLYADLKYVK